MRVCVVLMCGLLWAGLGSGAEAAGGAEPAEAAPEVVVLLDSAVGTLDPFLAADATSARVMHQLVCDTLVRLDTQLGYAPGVFASWRRQAGGLRWEFQVAAGFRFHNGQPLDARDVAFTLQRFLDPAAGSPYGGALRQAGLAVQVLGPLRLRLTLSAPRPSLLADLILPVVSRQSTKEGWICSGPFRLGQQSPQHLELLPHAGHPRGKPKVRLRLLPLSDETARFLRFRKGQAHLGINVLSPRRLARFQTGQLAKTYRVATSAGLTHQYLGFNLAHAALGRLEVRQALAHAIPTEALLRHLLHGLGTRATSVLPQGSPYLDPGSAPPPFDPQRAAALLDAAGLPPGKDGVRLRLNYHTTTNPNSRAMGRILKQAFAKIGVQLNVRAYEWGVFYSDILAGRFQLYSLRWIGVFEPAFRRSLLHSSQFPPQGRNRGRYHNPRMDALLDAAQRAPSEPERIALHRKIHRLMLQQLPFLPLWQRRNAAIIHRKLKGFVPHPSGGFETLSAISLE